MTSQTAWQRGPILVSTASVVGQEPNESRQGFSQPQGAGRLTIAHYLEQIAVEVEEVETVVVTPVDGLRAFHSRGSEPLSRDSEIGAAHAKGVMAPAERM